MTKEQKALLLAMSIGDGSIGLRKDRNGKIYTGNLSIIHCAKQSEYLKHKRDLLQKIIGGKEILIKDFKPKTGYSTNKLAYKIDKAHKYFRLIHRWLYSSNGKKFITRKILDKLTPQGLAVWYMDDGCAHKRKRKDGSVSSVQCFLATYCSLEEVNCIINYFQEKYQIRWTKCLHKSKYYLMCNTAGSRKFEEIIKNYIVPSMEYKLPKSYICKSADQS